MMRIAVITPYYKESLDVLRRCHASVKAQTHACDHYMLADGHPNPAVDEWPVHHIKLPNHNDSGNTPRLIGSASAAALGYDAICLLDADNWFEPDHVRTLVALQEASGAPIITCARMLRRPDESVLGLCREVDGRVFTDTNCYLLRREAFPALRFWALDVVSHGILGDRVVWQALVQSGLRRAHSPLPTVNYVTTYAVHYLERGEAPPPGAKVIRRDAQGRSTFEPYCHDAPVAALGEAGGRPRFQKIWTAAPAPRPPAPQDEDGSTARSS